MAEMTENKMEQVAALLGVELNEEFKVKGSLSKDGLYKMTVDGLYGYLPNTTHFKQDIMLVSLLRGECEVVKLPYKPQKVDEYASDKAMWRR